MARTPELSKLTRAELTAMARRKKIPMPSGILKDEMVKAIKKGLRKIEAQKKSKPATRKKAAPRKAKTSPEKAAPRKSPVKVKAKKAPAKRETLTELPASYGDHRLVVMARDPNWAYAYWELDPKRVHDLTQSAGPSSTRWVLRVYSAALHPEAVKGNYFDIVINVESRNFYLNLSRPGARFIAAIGVVDASGIFRTAAESNPVIMPLDQPAETVAPQGNPTAVFPVALK